ARSSAPAHVAEDRAEEIGEVAGASEVTVLDPEPGAAGSTGRGLRVALPVRTERVVAAALLGIRNNLVGLVDLLEGIGGGPDLCGVGVGVPGQPSVGGLDRLVVGLPVDAENHIVVLEVDGHVAYLPGSIADDLSLER